ncbi:membrane protein containing DUF340, prokaryotic membrane [gut metagenome]|uniref:Membrane protein containing DUF340, prokaryotic membrane n=1 Tax=gut metagenome TaxID=749906 RepID=J9G7S8_9ZZZZ
MLNVLLALWGSALLGWLCRKWPQTWLGDLLTLTVWMMLLLIGIEVGSNEMLMQSLGKLGLESAVATLLASVSCCIGAWWFWKYVCKGEQLPREKVTDVAGPKGWRRWWAIFRRLQDSLIILLCFILGCFLGTLGVYAYLPADAAFYCLCLLLACVGFSIGQSRDLVKSMKGMKKKMLFLPLVTMVFTWVGMLIASCIYSDRSWTEWLAVGSGFGYYSLSSILITEVKGAELGTIALLYNVIREILAIVLVPLWVRYFGPLAPISVGGATSADSTLPAISRGCGEKFVPVSVFHGIAVDFSVPFLVPFFCAW